MVEGELYDLLELTFSKFYCIYTDFYEMRKFM